ncbi:FAD/NAD(P)-binding domain-containing protein [Schizopora paradoxa]|uniref:FAD/NAD(P)-binding domain-containing protein n=1 Tax=Schizopora paradoxa TaxID=27342 RepID=A0A0H2RUH4_9AGAM|nr:FAD/NAD(P)-binding domain-containing protein [Schizopora paradoxa]
MCVISFAPNTGRLFERWGLGEELMKVCTQHTNLHIHSHMGHLLQTQVLPQKVFGSNSYNGRRGEIHAVLFEYAKRLGAEIKLGVEVTEYWENDVEKKAGVIVQGQRIEGDVVVGADGVGSKARQLVLGHVDEPKPSGYAIYRTWFDIQERGVDKDPLTSMFAKEDLFFSWIGEDKHMLAMSMKGGKEMCWLLTHKDTADIKESWSQPGKISDALTIVDDWDPRCRAIVSKASFCIDFKLVIRDPLPTWVSPGGRIVVIGDAAHPFLPSSIQGASQGVEDGVALAVALKNAGKDKIPAATRVFEHLRYDRVLKSQQMGESTRNKWHKKNEDKGDDVELPFPEWLLNFDAERHAQNTFGQIFDSLKEKGYARPNVHLLYHIDEAGA